MTSASSQATITYNRSERQYEWLDPESGQVLTAPPGAKNKAQLFQAVVAMLDPDLYDCACRVIGNQAQLERVVWKAVELVINEAVETFMAEGSLLAKVQASDEYGRYAISADDGYTVCQCVSFTSHEAPLTSSGQRMCKHILAYKLYQFVRENRF